MLEDSFGRTSRRCFPGQTVLEATVIRLARDAELELDDEGGRTHLEVVEREVRRRRRSDVVRLEMESSASPELLALLRDQLESQPGEIYLIPGPLDLRGLLPVDRASRVRRLRDPPLQPADVLAAIRSRAICLRCWTSATSCCTIPTSPTTRWSR